MSQNKVPDFFSGKSGKVIPRYNEFYSKTRFIGFQRNFEFFNSVQAINIYAKYPNFAFVQGSVDLVI